MATQGDPLTPQEQKPAKGISVGRVTRLIFSVALAFAFAFYAFGFQSPVTSKGRPAGDISLLQPPSGTENSHLLDPNNPLAIRVPYRPVNSDVAGVTSSPGVASSLLQRPKDGFLMAPLENLIRTSSFGPRLNPITGEPGEVHFGQDFAAPCGTRVYSADAGVVRAAGWHPWGGGNRLEIDHGNGLITTYNHLLAVATEKERKIRVGEVIAEVGTTGSSTGCHLHFEVIENKVHRNPNNWTLLDIQQIDKLVPGRMFSFDPGAVRTAGWTIPINPETPYSKGSSTKPPTRATPPPTSPTPICTATPPPTGCPAAQPDCASTPQAPGCQPDPSCSLTPPPSGCTVPLASWSAGSPKLMNLALQESGSSSLQAAPYP